MALLQYRVELKMIISISRLTPRLLQAEDVDSGPPSILYDGPDPLEQSGDLQSLSKRYV